MCTHVLQATVLKLNKAYLCEGVVWRLGQAHSPWRRCMVLTVKLNQVSSLLVFLALTAVWKSQYYFNMRWNKVARGGVPSFPNRAHHRPW